MYMLKARWLFSKWKIGILDFIIKGLCRLLDYYYDVKRIVKLTFIISLLLTGRILCE